MLVDMNTSAPSTLRISEERTAATITHLAGPISSFVSAGWLAIVGPLVAWFIYRDRSEYVRRQAAEAFNFQISMWLTAVIGGLLCLTVILIPVGVIMMLAAVVGSVVMGVIAALRTSSGQTYRYPWRIQILR